MVRMQDVAFEPIPIAGVAGSLNGHTLIINSCFWEASIISLILHEDLHFTLLDIGGDRLASKLDDVWGTLMQTTLLLDPDLILSANWWIERNE
jgi:hypothetical protein